jgi:hypothetical protein
MIIEELYPKILVFRNALKNTEDFLNEILLSEKYVDPWHQWYTLGNQTLFKKYPNFIFSSFPSDKEWKNSCNLSDNEFAKNVANIFYECTKIYVDKYNIKIDNWNHGNPTICSHYPKEADSILAMQYHTDFIISQTNNPGYKHSITCNLYINDDYEGGEVIYKIFKDENNYDEIKYKPKSGDAVVFLSTPPYFHGVRKNQIKDKYFIRMFWGYDYRGSEEWLQNQDKYGKEVWERMEKERVDFENKSSMWMKGHKED